MCVVSFAIHREHDLIKEDMDVALKMFLIKTRSCWHESKRTIMHASHLCVWRPRKVFCFAFQMNCRYFRERNKNSNEMMIPQNSKLTKNASENVNLWRHKPCLSSFENRIYLYHFYFKLTNTKKTSIKMNINIRKNNNFFCLTYPNKRSSCDWLQRVCWLFDEFQLFHLAIKITAYLFVGNT